MNQPRNRLGCEGSGKRMEKKGREEPTEPQDLQGGRKGDWAGAGLGLAGVLREPAGAEAVYLVSH